MTTTTTKRAVSTRRILEKSIKDIEAGLWTCNDLSCPVETEDHPDAVKPMGCALGLVGINAGLCEIVERDGTLYAVGLDYPKKDWPKSALKAVTLLAETSRATKAQREEAEEDVGTNPGDFAIPVEQGIVWRYNDSGIGKVAALNWFKRALAKLNEAAK